MVKDEVFSSNQEKNIEGLRNDLAEFITELRDLIRGILSQSSSSVAPIDIETANEVVGKTLKIDLKSLKNIQDWNVLKSHIKNLREFEGDIRKRKSLSGSINKINKELDLLIKNTNTKKNFLQKTLEWISSRRNSKKDNFAENFKKILISIIEKLEKNKELYKIDNSIIRSYYKKVDDLSDEDINNIVTDQRGAIIRVFDSFYDNMSSNGISEASYTHFSIQLDNLLRICGKRLDSNGNIILN